MFIVAVCLHLHCVLENLSPYQIYHVVILDIGAVIKFSYLNIITLWTLDLATEFAAICREFPYPKPYSLSSSYSGNKWSINTPSPASKIGTRAAVNGQKSRRLPTPGLVLIDHSIV